MAIIRPRSSRGSALVTLETEISDGGIARKVPRNADGQCGVDELSAFFYKYRFHVNCEYILVTDLDDEIADYEPSCEVWKESPLGETYIETSEAGNIKDGLFKNVFNPSDPNHYSMIYRVVGHIAKHSRGNKGLNINRVICYFNLDDDDDTSFHCTIELKKPSAKRTKGTTRHNGLNTHKNSSLPHGARNDGK